MLDLVGSPAHGDILYRGASGWTRLAAGTAGQVLKTGGAGANLSWGTVSGAGDLVGPASAVNESIPVYDGTTGKLLKGQTVATIVAGRLKVKSNGTQQMLHAVADDGVTQADITATTYGLTGGGILHGRLANGTEAAPTKVTVGQVVGGFGCRAYYGTTGFHISSPASIHMEASETQENSAWGMHINFWTTPVGATARQLRCSITENGTLWCHDEAPTFDAKNRLQTAPVGDCYILASGANDLRSGRNAAVGAFAYGGTSAGFRGGVAGGTPGSPTTTPANSIISFMGGHVFDGTAWTGGTKALLAFKSAQAATSSAQGTYITLETTPLNSTARAERMRVSPAGNLLIGTIDDTAGFANAAGNVKVANSLVFEGGGPGRGIRYQATTANGSVATTMGSVGPTGATAGNPSGWFRMYSGTAGRDVFVPFW